VLVRDRSSNVEEENMTTTRKINWFIWVMALGLILACVPSIPVSAPALPTFDPNAVGTFIAMTANAAATQTAAARPSATLTPSVTPTRNTETPSPTATNTVIFVLPSRTPIVIPTFTNVILSGGGSSSDNYACRITKVTPPYGSSFSPREDFDVIWTVTNIGRKNWDRTDIDYIYASGAKIHKISGYDLDKNVKVGNSIGLGVDMQAPKDPGTYQTYWTMRIGSKEFCSLTYTLVVK
jgi:hypothetical protein